MRLTKTVYIKPAFLGPDIVHTIETEVRSRFLGSCSAEHGYITHISNIVILETKTEYSVTDIAVKVSCSVTTSKPYVGERRKCVVKSQIPQGTMMYAYAAEERCDQRSRNKESDVCANIGYRVFVPAAHALNESGNTVTDFPVGSVVEIEILAVKYNKQQFTCIGKYI